MFGKGGGGGVVEERFEIECVCGSVRVYARDCTLSIWGTSKGRGRNGLCWVMKS